MAATVPLKTQKRLLRKSLTATLSNLSDIASQSTAVTSRVLGLPAFQTANSVSCYLSMPSGELDTSTLVSEILNLGKSLFVPKIDKSMPRKMDFLQIFDQGDLNSLPSGVWGIKEPDADRAGKPRPTAQDAPLDVILMPGVAFDRSMSRLGHGKGYYDSFIADYVKSGKPRPVLVALALREQLLAAKEIPMNEYDWSVDIIVTPDELVFDKRQVFHPSSYPSPCPLEKV